MDRFERDPKGDGAASARWRRLRDLFGEVQDLPESERAAFLDRELAGDNTFRTRFRLEAQAASRMAHPTIVRVYDAGEDTVLAMRPAKVAAVRTCVVPAALLHRQVPTSSLAIYDQLSGGAR